MKDLIYLFGSTGTGKSSVALNLMKADFLAVELDNVINHLYPLKSNLGLTGNEIKTAYEKVGKTANELLAMVNVVVPEWFYTRNSLDLVQDQITTEARTFYIQLTASLDNVLQRNSQKRQPVPEDLVKEMHRLTMQSPGVYYQKFDPHKIHTVGRPVSQIADDILEYIKED